MYKGYNLSITSGDFGAVFGADSTVSSSILLKYAILGRAFIEQYQKKVAERLRTLGSLTVSKVLDGNEIEEVWFPKIDSQVFISHSHTDTDLAFALSGWLKAKFGVSSFIDSAVWGYRGDLIRKLSHGLDSSDTQKMVEHVDCMLVKSLMQMIDQCECLIFLNTPNSICAQGVLAKTLSPWLFYELNVSRYIRLNVPRRHLLRKSAEMNESVLNSQENFSRMIVHSVQVNHLMSLDVGKLREWRISADGLKGEFALDKLYAITDKARHIAHI